MMSETQLSPVGRFEEVLLATDGSDYCTGAERVAIALCADQNAHLQVVSAMIRHAEAGWMGAKADGDLERDTIDNLERVENLAKQAGISCTTHLMTGDDPYKVIVDASKSLLADVIVMGRRGRRGLARLMLGDATAKVIGYAPCAVLVAPEESTMWHSLLLATDGSRFSDAAAVTAAELARPNNLPLFVLSVRVPIHSDRRQAEAEPIVERVLGYMKDQGLSAEGMVEEGAADETIVSVAEERGVGLIVLGSFGRTGIGRVLFGTKAERVINQTKGPVMIVRGG